MRTVGLQLIQEKKAEIALLDQSGKDSVVDPLGKDVLSALRRSNMKERDSERLDDEGVLAQ